MSEHITKPGKSGAMVTEGLLRRVDELQKVDINPALDPIDDPLGQQAAAWGSDWTDLLSAIDAFAFLKGGEPRG